MIFRHNYGPSLPCSSLGPAVTYSSYQLQHGVTLGAASQCFWPVESAAATLNTLLLTSQPWSWWWRMIICHTSYNVKLGYLLIVCMESLLWWFPGVRGGRAEQWVDLTFCFGFFPLINQDFAFVRARILLYLLALPWFDDDSYFFTPTLESLGTYWGYRDDIGEGAEAARDKW